MSEDTDNEMTLEYIVKDYRKVLRNAGIKAPYILMPHSIGGVYANYWSSRYPDEIEAIVFVDGTQMSEDAYSDETVKSVGVGDRMENILGKMGFSRWFLREINYEYPDNYTAEEQYLGGALAMMTETSVAYCSETGLKAENAPKAYRELISNDIPKLYICASWGIRTREDVIALNTWLNSQIEKNHLDISPKQTDPNDEYVNKLISQCEQLRNDIIYPYAEKWGIVKLFALPETMPFICRDLMNAAR